jgi:hypothetical protein
MAQIPGSLLEALDQLAQDVEVDAKNILADDFEITLSELKQVAWKLNLDQAAFEATYGHSRSAFMTALRTRYDSLWSRNRSNSKQERSVRGMLGFLWLTARLIDLSTMQREHAQVPDAELSRCDALLNDSEIANVLRVLYQPPEPDGASNSSSTSSSIKNWNSIDWGSISLYKVGSTSMILKCTFTDDYTERILKCVLFPYTAITDIQVATAGYLHKIGDNRYKSVARVASSTGQWILMEYVPGETLEEIFRKLSARPNKGLLTAEYASRLGLPILSALQELSGSDRTESHVIAGSTNPHPVPLQHEDLTPSNIIVTGDWNEGACGIKLIDVGRNYLFSRRLGLNDSSEALYVAPEIREGSPEPTSDLFSFGRILTSLLDPHRRGDGRISDKIYQEIPEMARFVEDLVDKNPVNRLIVNQDVCTRNEQNQVLSISYGMLKAQLKAEFELLERTEGSRQAGQDSPRSWSQLFRPNAGLKERYRTWAYARRNVSNFPRFAAQAAYLFYWSTFAAFVLVLGVGASAFFAGLNTKLDLTPQWLVVIDYFTDNQGTTVLGKIRQPGYEIGNLGVNLSGCFIAFAMVVTSVKYYQAMLGGLTTYRVRLPGWFVTEITLRWATFTGLLPVLVCDFVQPRWWPWVAAGGGAAIMTTNFVCHRFARSCAREATRLELSTGPSEHDPSLIAYSQWWWSQAIYNAFMLVIGWGIYQHKLNDYWVYAVGIGCTTLFVQYALKCTLAAGSIRGILARCFIAGERAQAKKEIFGAV